MTEVTLYTDGACSGNPGPGGWAALLVEDGAERIVSGAEPHTTNQRMELRAAIEGLAAVAGRRTVHVFTDSSYVMNCFRDRWWTRWEATVADQRTDNADQCFAVLADHPDTPAEFGPVITAS